MTRMNKRQFLKYGGTALGAGMLAGVLGPIGARAQGAGLTVAWWGEGDQNKRTADAMQAYAKASGITIDPQGTNFNGYWDRLATQVAGGNAPDVFQVFLATMAEYAARGTIEPIGNYLGSVIDTSDWAPAARDSVYFGGEQYFVPLGLSTQPAIIYDKTVLEGIGITELKPDWTLAEFREIGAEIAEALSADGEQKFGMDDMGGSQTVLEAFVRSKGVNMFTDEGQLGFSKDDLIEWYEFWDEARAAGVAVAPEARQQGGFEATGIIRGVAAFSTAASTKGLQGFQSLSQNQLEFNPWPRYAADSERIELVTPVEWMVISATSDQKDEAAALLNFIVNDPASITAMGISKGAPVGNALRKQILESGELSETETKIYNVVEEALPYSKPRVIYPPGSGPLVGPGTPLIALLNDQIAFKQIAIPAAVDRFFSEADRNL
ncbi:ABC transporter substrate-binding protein [Devosia nitrariae]|uniref:ABC transporter ATP-binding protein n=1 Tax=Devosia nitrariae TaxID=2071872 RepID=A0ABQ5W705_9HYPH|nr:extracellular solute-binding protein [Devosia nitrariae]GLQ55854.1 ABC transporter ATP-binding protein [Devosia nitrariae]